MSVNCNPKKLKCNNFPEFHPLLIFFLSKQLMKRIRSFANLWKNLSLSKLTKFDDNSHSEAVEYRKIAPSIGLSSLGSPLTSHLLPQPLKIGTVERGFRILMAKHYDGISLDSMPLVVDPLLMCLESLRFGLSTFLFGRLVMFRRQYSTRQRLFSVPNSVYIFHELEQWNKGKSWQKMYSFWSTKFCFK